MKIITFSLMLVIFVGCSSTEEKPSDDPFVTGKKVEMYGCEIWKEKNPKADC